MFRAMKMFAGFLAVSLIGAVAYKLDRGATGRYQVVPARLDYYTLPLLHDNNGASIKEIVINTAIRIDTQTGKTWYLTRFEKKNLMPGVGWTLAEENDEIPSDNSEYGLTPSPSQK